MSGDVLEQRRKYYGAWNAVLSSARTFPPNPRHDRHYAGTTPEVRERATPQRLLDLDAELAAWEQASDDDFEQFEQSLE